MGLPFNRYVGSRSVPKNVATLTEKYPQAEFIHADIELVELEPFDMAFSSLVFKHLYPDFGAAVRNIPLRIGGKLVFDLIEGRKELFTPGTDTFIRHYSREEIERLVSGAGLAVLRYEEVEHVEGEPEWNRLLVCCIKA